MTAAEDSFLVFGLPGRRSVPELMAAARRQVPRDFTAAERRRYLHESSPGGMAGRAPVRKAVRPPAVRHAAVR